MSDIKVSQCEPVCELDEHPVVFLTHVAYSKKSQVFDAESTIIQRAFLVDKPPHITQVCVPVPISLQH